jgi:hypothetical protein
MLRGGVRHDLGPEHFNRLAVDWLPRHCVRCLEQMGHRLILKAKAEVAFEVLRAFSGSSA